MQIRELRYIVTLARLLNFTKAAEELGISQPVLSRSIQALERRHHLRFFDREKGRVHLTAAGQDFAARAAVVLREIGELEARLKRTADGEVGELLFGMTPIIAKALLSKILLDSLASAPDLDIRAVVRPSPEFPALLESQEIEFFISSRMFFPDPPTVRSTLLGHLPVVAMVRSGHPLLESEAGGTRSFRILSTTKLHDARYTPGFLASRTAQSNAIVIEDSDALLHVAEASDVVFIGTPFAAVDALQAGRLVLLPVPAGEPQLKVEVVMYNLNGRTLSPLANRVREKARSDLRRLWQDFDQHLRGPPHPNTPR